MSPVKNTPIPDILGSALKAARESRRYERNELASLCCLSAKMITELEEGGMSSFYSYPLKINAAKRVGTLLNLAESDYLNYPRAAIVTTEENEEASLASGVKNERNGSVSSKKTPLSAQDSVSTTDAVDSAITERLEWQELLTEKVGGDLAEANSRGGFRFPVKSIAFLSLGVVIAGVVFSLNSKYDIAYQVAALLDREHKPHEMLPVEPPKVASDEAKTEVQNPPAEASQEVKPPEATAVAASQCPYKQDAQLLSYQSPNPTKLGDVVNLKTLIKQTFCFIDGSGKQLVIALEANTAHAFKGVAPFTVLGQDLDSVEMFYQGWRVRLPNAGSKQVKLVEVNL